MLLELLVAASLSQEDGPPKPPSAPPPPAFRKGDRPPPPRDPFGEDGPLPERKRGDAEGRRPPREGAFGGDAEGRPRDGERPRGERPRDGERPRAEGPRDGDRPRPPGPRDADFGSEGGRPREGRPPFDGPPARRPPMMYEMAEDPEIRAFNERERTIEGKTRELAERAQRLRGEDRDKAVASLKEVVAEHFALRQERREHEIKRIAEQLEKLKASVKKRADEKQAVIDRRVKELLHDDDTGF